MSFQELEVAEPRYPERSVPDLSKFPMKSNPSVAECQSGEEEAFYRDPPVRQVGSATQLWSCSAKPLLSLLEKVGLWLREVQ